MSPRPNLFQNVHLDHGISCKCYYNFCAASFQQQHAIWGWIKVKLPTDNNLNFHCCFKGNKNFNWIAHVNWPLHTLWLCSDLRDLGVAQLPSALSTLKLLHITLWALAWFVSKNEFIFYETGNFYVTLMKYVLNHSLPAVKVKPTTWSLYLWPVSLSLLDFILGCVNWPKFFTTEITFFTTKILRTPNLNMS